MKTEKRRIEGGVFCIIGKIGREEERGGRVIFNRAEWKRERGYFTSREEKWRTGEGDVSAWLLPRGCVLHGAELGKRVNAGDPGALGTRPPGW